MPAPGVPASVAVPLPLLVKVTPVGRAPVWVIVAAVGVPVVVTVKVPALPTVKVVALALVNAAPALTVRVKLCVALAPTPLAAVMVSG